MGMSNPCSWASFAANKGKLQIGQEEILIYDSPTAHFQMNEDLDYVLTRGPWVIAIQHLVAQKWKPNFVPGEDSIQFILIGVKITKLLMEWIDLDLFWNT
ncbi:hypothetical protein Dsin_008864 [Dipteronia sinensis]|uniref:DUF4283 domain-containing protein n=1 Tax=Dipteronia sinensis TaxID=43782 RepID=A0AAE0AQL8_9ROSI|nr:hypothetical protein Dsin_008864 [Dipteronia sinensis]